MDSTSSTAVRQVDSTSSTAVRRMEESVDDCNQVWDCGELKPTNRHIRRMLQYVKWALCSKPDPLSVRLGRLRGRHVTCRLRARQAARSGTSPAARDRRAESGPTNAESRRTSPAARDRRAESGPTSAESGPTSAESRPTSAESGPTSSPPQLTLTLTVPNSVTVIVL